MELLGVQMDIAWEDVAPNLARAAELVDAAAPTRGSLIVLPEMFSTGFTMNLDAAVGPADRPAEACLAALARRHGSTVLGGVATRGPDGRGRNEAVAFDPQGNPLARLAKLHPFTLAGEREVYTPGSAIVTFPWQQFTVCPFVCYDIRFPEVFRLAVRRGANLFIIIANWPAGREAHWRTLAAARAIENQAYVLAVNRCGSDPRGPAAGASLIIDPQGNILADAGSGETVIRARPDLGALREYRRRFPVIADIRADALPPDE